MPGNTTSKVEKGSAFSKEVGGHGGPVSRAAKSLVLPPSWGQRLNCDGHQGLLCNREGSLLSQLRGENAGLAGASPGSGRVLRAHSAHLAQTALGKAVRGLPVSFLSPCRPTGESVPFHTFHKGHLNQIFLPKSFLSVGLAPRRQFSS